MRILIDQDSVLYDLCSVWYGQNSQYHKDFNHWFSSEEQTDWDVTKFVVPECGSKIYDYFSNPELWNIGKPVANSIEVTQKLVEDGHELVIVTTAATPESLAPKWNWLKEYFPHIKDVIICNGKQKHMIIGDILIDDAPHNLEGFIGIPILFTQPWNKSYEDKNWFLRAYSWLDIYDVIRLAVMHTAELTTPTRSLEISTRENRGL